MLPGVRVYLYPWFIETGEVFGVRVNGSVVRGLRGGLPVLASSGVFVVGPVVVGEARRGGAVEGVPWSLRVYGSAPLYAWLVVERGVDAGRAAGAVDVLVGAIRGSGDGLVDVAVDCGVLRVPRVLSERLRGFQCVEYSGLESPVGGDVVVAASLVAGVWAPSGLRGEAECLGCLEECRSGDALSVECAVPLAYWWAKAGQGAGVPEVIQLSPEGRGCGSCSAWALLTGGGVGVCELCCFSEAPCLRVMGRACAERVRDAGEARVRLDRLAGQLPRLLGAAGERRVLVEQLYSIMCGGLGEGVAGNGGG